jgi:hypothetical protein
MKKTLVAALVIAVLGCSGEDHDRQGKSPKLADENHTPHRAVDHGAPSIDRAWFGTDSGAQEKNPEFADESQTPAQAVEHGAPSIDKAWLPTDYVAFDAYLARLPSHRYPRVGSSRSSPLFMKVIESAEQPILAKKDIHLNSRMELGLQMQQAANSTLKRYAWAHSAGTDYSKELAHLLGLSLAMTRQLLLLVDEFIPTIDPDDGKYEVRMQGLEKVKRAMPMQLDGVVLSMKEANVYSDMDRRIIAKYLVAEAPGILDRMEQSIRREFQVKIKELESSETDPVAKQLLVALSKSIGGGSNELTGDNGQ